jgi:signal transduction histidine kinase
MQFRNQIYARILLNAEPVSTDATATHVLQGTDMLDAEIDDTSESDRQWPRFFDRLVHDLREPLRSITAFTQLLNESLLNEALLNQTPPDDPHEPLNPQAQHAIEEILSSANRMKMLIEAVSRYSATLQNDGSASAASLQLALDMTTLTLQTEIEACGASVIGSGLPRVQAGLDQLGRIFEALIRNSLLFRALDPPVIRVSAERDASGNWLISVEDNGIGIEPADREAIFDPFTRMCDRKYPGVGMGLAICRNIVRNHGGIIWMEPASVRGAICRFTLPAAD